MSATIQINARGSMTLPKELRRLLGLEKGGMVMVESAPGGILLRPSVSYPIELYSDEQIAAFDAEDAALARHMGPGNA